MSVFQEIYDSEINFSISVVLWDGGFEVKLGDNLNGFEAEDKREAWERRRKLVTQTATRLYPFSKLQGTVELRQVYGERKRDTFRRRAITASPVWTSAEFQRWLKVEFALAISGLMDRYELTPLQAATIMKDHLTSRQHPLRQARADYGRTG